MKYSPLLSVQEAARYTGVNYKRIYRLIKKGHIVPEYDNLGRIRLNMSTIAALRDGLEKQTVPIEFNLDKLGYIGDMEFDIMAKV